MIDVRLIQQSDIEDVKAAARCAHAESQYHAVPLDMSTIDGLISAALNPQAPVLCVVAYKNRILVGLIAFSISPHFFTRQLFASDLLLWVCPFWRGDDFARQLLAVAEKELTDLYGPLRIIVGTSFTGASGSAADHLYRHAGYRYLGTTYIKSPPPQP